MLLHQHGGTLLLLLFVLQVRLYPCVGKKGQFSFYSSHSTCNLCKPLVLLLLGFSYQMTKDILLRPNQSVVLLGELRGDGVGGAQQMSRGQHPTWHCHRSHHKQTRHAKMEAGVVQHVTDLFRRRLNVAATQCVLCSVILYTVYIQTPVSLCSSLFVICLSSPSILKSSLFSYLSLFLPFFISVQLGQCVFHLPKRTCSSDNDKI